jgi:hypothetical protein
LLPSVGSAVGTAAHVAVAAMQRRRLAGEVVSVDTRAADLRTALDAFRADIAPGAEWDDTTPSLQVAEFQIERMAERCFASAEAMTPAAVELSLSAEIADGWTLTGTLDLLTTDAHLDDMKTGALRRPYQAQLGGYALLAKANGYEVRTAGTTFIARGKKTKPQPPAERQSYDLPTAERAAYATIQAIKRDVEAFKASGDPFAFPANPMSLMCSRRYCPAFETEFCTMHLPARGGAGLDVD